MFARFAPYLYAQQFYDEFYPVPQCEVKLGADANYGPECDLQVLEWAERWLTKRKLGGEQQRPFLMTIFLTATHYPYSASVERSERDAGHRRFDNVLGWVWDALDQAKVRNKMRKRYRETVKFVDSLMDRVHI